MKKIICIIILLFFIFPLNVSAIKPGEKIDVKFSSCVDGDTAKFIMNKKTIKVRFLAIDTPETSHPKKGEEPYGKEAKEFTCNKISNANKIQLEFDKNSDIKDKYDRYLAWVFVDDYLLQSELIKNGLAEVAYLYGDYKYTPILQDYEQQAKINKIGKYSENDNSYYTKEKNKKSKKISASIEEKLIDKIIDSIKDFVLSILEEIF